MDRSKSYQTILVLAVAALIANLFFDKTWLVHLALGLMGLSLLSGWIADKISWLWLEFAEILGSVNTKILFGIIFFLLLTPIALVYRLFGKSNLQLKRKGANESYFSERNHVYEAKDLKNLW